MFRLPFSFIITGMVSFVLFHLLTLTDLAGWAAEAPRGPEGWFHIHLIVLGWATMIAMGAVYQLINVVLQSDLFSTKLGFVHYGLFTVGTTGLLAGFRTVNTQWIALFAAIASAGILLFAVNIGMTLWRAKQWNTITISTACAVGYLCLTALSGMLMGLNFRFDFLGMAHEQLFGAHIWLGTAGWFGMLITGFSYKLLPMFYLSHDYPEKLQLGVLTLWNAAVVLGAASFLSGVQGLLAGALIAITAALALYVIHMEQIKKRKHKKTPGAGIAWTIWSARTLLVMAAGGSVLFAIDPAFVMQGSVPVLALWMYLYGWVAITILGYLSKIVPFLWWTHKYGTLAGNQKVPTMGQLLAEKPIHWGLAAVIVCLGGVCVGLGLDAAAVTTTAGSLLSLAAIGYMAQIAYVFKR
jgi:hypothetical protein